MTFQWKFLSSNPNNGDQDNFIISLWFLKEQKTNGKEAVDWPFKKLLVGRCCCGKQIARYKDFIFARLHFWKTKNIFLPQKMLRMSHSIKCDQFTQLRQSDVLTDIHSRLQTRGKFIRTKRNYDQSQCHQIGLLLKGLSDKFNFTSSPIILWLFVAILK